MKLLSVFLLFSFPVMLSAQVLPDSINTLPFECPPPENPVIPRNEAERLQQESRARYRSVLPAYLIAMPETPIYEIIMPVVGVQVSRVADTWGAARGGGRFHEGQDIFAPAGTPIYSGTEGYIYRIAPSILGGNTVTVVTNAGWRIYYAHLSHYADDIREGQFVTTDSRLGYVGNTGNAITTPPHLHLGIYTSPPGRCDWHAIDPLPLLTNRVLLADQD